MYEDLLIKSGLTGREVGVYLILQKEGELPANNKNAESLPALITSGGMKTEPSITSRHDI